MMRFDVLTVLPDAFQGFTASQIMQRALDKNLFKLNIHNIRDFTDDPHRSVDDTPYSGGPGMVLKPEPIVSAIESLSTGSNAKPLRIYLTPKGEPWNQKLAQEFSAHEHLILLCGRYRGVDQRVLDGWIDREISLGNYLLSGGETAAMAVMETVMRLIPGVLGNPDSLSNETSLEDGWEPPLYTRPATFRDMAVPEVLRSGNHAKIKEWQEQHRRASQKDQS